MFKNQKKNWMPVTSILEKLTLWKVTRRHYATKIKFITVFIKGLRKAQTKLSKLLLMLAQLVTFELKRAWVETVLQFLYIYIDTWNKGISIVHVFSPSFSNLLKPVIQLTGMQDPKWRATLPLMLFLPFDAVLTCSAEENYHLDAV